MAIAAVAQFAGTARSNALAEIEFVLVMLPPGRIACQAGVELSFSSSFGLAVALASWD